MKIRNTDHASVQTVHRDDGEKVGALRRVSRPAYSKASHKWRVTCSLCGVAVVGPHNQTSRRSDAIQLLKIHLHSHHERTG